MREASVESARRLFDWEIDAPALDPAETVRHIRKGTLSRVAFAVLMALVATSVLPWTFCAGWALAIIGWELVARKAGEDAWALRSGSTSASFAKIAALNFIGGAGYALFPMASWLTYDPIGMVLATAWVSGAANHLFVYFASCRVVALATLAPLMGVTLTAPFLAQGFSAPALLGVLILLCLIAAAGVFGYDRVMMVRALAAQKTKRQAAERLSQEKSKFLATMSHELRGPMNDIVGYADLIEEEVEAGGDARKIKQTAQHVLRLLNVIQDCARLESGAAQVNRESAPVEAVLRDVAQAADQLAAANGAKLRFSGGGDLGEAELDQMRLHQCLLQIVAVAARQARSGEVSLAASRKRGAGGDVLRFEVANSGAPMDEQQRTRLFEPFASLDHGPGEEDRGVGLAFARDIARLMGGDIVYGEANGRPTLTLELGVAARAA